MANKKFINDPDNLVDELLEGLVLANARTVALEGDHLVVRAEPKSSDKVAIVTLGGAGHEPALSGFVGHGMLDISVPGQIFAAPGPPRVVEALRKAVDESMSGKVVSLARVRELRRQLTWAGCEEDLAEMWADWRQMVRTIFLLNARILLDWVQHRCEYEGLSLAESAASATSVASAASTADNEALERVVDGLRYCSVFKRYNAQARRLYCEGHGLPWVSVQSHTRAGIPVRGYERYTGTPHYDALPVDEYPPAVGKVVRLLQKSPPRPVRKLR